MIVDERTVRVAAITLTHCTSLTAPHHQRFAHALNRKRQCAEYLFGAHPHDSVTEAFELPIPAGVSRDAANVIATVDLDNDFPKEPRSPRYTCRQ